MFLFMCVCTRVCEHVDVMSIVITLLYDVHIELHVPKVVRILYILLFFLVCTKVYLHIKEKRNYYSILVNILRLNLFVCVYLFTFCLFVCLRAHIIEHYFSIRMS